MNKTDVHLKLVARVGHIGPLTDGRRKAVLDFVRVRLHGFNSVEVLAVEELGLEEPVETTEPAKVTFNDVTEFLNDVLGSDKITVTCTSEYRAIHVRGDLSLSTLVFVLESEPMAILPRNGMLEILYDR